MRLEVDIGNSRIKWRLINGGEVVLLRAVVYATPVDYSVVFAALSEVPEEIWEGFCWK